jgi:hypothetical protein
MNTVILTSQVGADGVLNVTVLLKPEDVNRSVAVFHKVLSWSS